LVIGLLHTVEKRWLDALVAFTSVPEDVIDAAESMTRCRLLVLTAWVRIAVGREHDEVTPVLTRASLETDPDPALIGYAVFADGMASLRRSDDAALGDAVESIPDVASAVPQALTYKLAWRGSIFAFWGKSSEAERDLGEVTTRIRAGETDIGDGVYNALLAFARWQSGEWNLGQVELSIALELAIGQPHPMNRAIEPMFLAVRGEFEAADGKLRETEVIVQSMPMVEAVHLFTISMVARAHAGGDAEVKRRCLAELRRVFGPRATRVEGFTGSVWLAHVALAAIWAHELDRARELIRASEQGPMPPDWLPWVNAWLEGLIAEAEGDQPRAVRLFERAIGTFTDDLPLYRAHVVADRARLAEFDGDRDGHARFTDDARSLYRMLGALPYVERLSSDSLASVNIFAPLSSRERDVATLLVSGLTSAQIARDLYISRATVGFHLTRIYAKTGVTSKHDLIDLVHNSVTDPPRTRASF
jgi:DNA-binding CsgD family transcriptional regulator